MKLVVTAVYGEEEVLFPTVVGDGRKTFKWLGLSIAERFCQKRPHGSLRRREARPSVVHGTVLLPTLIWSSEENVYHPDDLLVDRLYDGQDVRVVLGQKQPLDERSEPDFTAWQLLACRCSNEWRSKRAIAEKKLQEQRGKRGAVCLTPEEQEKLRIATAKAEQMRDVMHYQLLSETRTRQAFEVDWSHMHEKGRLDALVPMPEDQDGIRRLLLEHYMLLTELFRSFAAQGSGGLTNMDYREFQAALHMLGMRHVVQEAPLVQRIFVECFDANLPETHRLTLSLELPEFLLVLIQLAYALYIDRLISRHLPSLPWSSIARRRVALIESTGTEVPSICEAMTELVTEFVLPYASDHLTTFVVKQSLSSTSVLMTMGELHESLLKVYRQYARLTPSSYMFQSLMDLKELYAACKDAKLLDKDYDEKASPVPLKDIKMSFAFVQNQHDAGAKEQGDNDEQLSYPEFLECIARIGVLRFAAEGRLSVSEKIKAGLKAVAALAHPTHNVPVKRKGNAAQVVVHEEK